MLLFPCLAPFFGSHAYSIRPSHGVKSLANIAISSEKKKREEHRHAYLVHLEALAENTID